MSTGGARVASTDSAVVHDFLSAEESAAQAAPSPWPSQRVFDCKTCNRRFSSFQALGGHRASHKEPELDLALSLSTADASRRSKTHTCAICGEDFPIGQALGGHMRRHRRAPVVRRTPAAPSNPSSPAP